MEHTVAFNVDAKLEGLVKQRVEVVLIQCGSEHGITVHYVDRVSMRRTVRVMIRVARTSWGQSVEISEPLIRYGLGRL